MSDFYYYKLTKHTIDKFMLMVVVVDTPLIKTFTDSESNTTTLYTLHIFQKR